eukprot:CAMPEP_0196762426 /NCGR_PEP_ID=MMETSP1095-20130614/1934_1 /TAXON_ID=96789 ORGANISM="Chromulina nebulosa, Strain UTEXLB2642" /NCGR_SAMPLE_ID=MMETSP1095 /ASSEMBLY_ACC=CAM_ASM_000446 /LENGTH=384 /DNA_ID=CAMNT_0042113301 /DNA_START=39 /DNA_END=1190 /DNA_ORIENTATION=-
MDDPEFSMGNPMSTGKNRPKSNIPNSPKKMESIRKGQPSNRINTSNAPPPPPRVASNSPTRYNRVDDETKDTADTVVDDERPQKPRKIRGEKSMDIVELNQLSSTEGPTRGPSQKLDRQKSQNPSKSGNVSKENVEKIKSTKSDEEPGRKFRGKNIIQYGLWAHYMGYGCSLMCVTLGFFACLWTTAHTWGGGKCTVNGTPINSIYIPDPTTGQCLATYNGHQVCCDANSESSLVGNIPVGVIYVLYGLFIIPYENITWGYGLWFPTDSFFYRNRISPIGIFHILVSIIGFTNYATALAAACLLTNGGIYAYAAYRFEGGDGGRVQSKKAYEQKLAAKQKAIQDGTAPTFSENISNSINHVLQWNPIAFYKRIYNEDKLSSYFW